MTEFDPTIALKLSDLDTLQKQECLRLLESAEFAGIDPVEILCDLARHSAKEVRRFAVHEMAKLSLRNDTGDALKNRIADALAERGHDPMEDIFVRRHAVQTLGFMETPSGLKHLLIFVTLEPNADLRASAANALGYYEGEDSASITLLTVLQNTSEDSMVRAFAAESLGKLEYGAALPTLIDSLSDTAPVVRYLTAVALGWIGDPLALPALDRSAAQDHALCEIESEHDTVSEKAREASARIRSAVAGTR